MRFAALMLCVCVAIAITTPSTRGAAPNSTTPSTLDWPTFRGAQRTGVSSDTGLLQQWPEGGPPLLWDMPGAGRGYASLAVAGERIYTLGDAPSTANDQDEYLLAFDRRTGKPVWKLKVGAPWTDGKPTWQSSRSTPTADGNALYALSAHGDLICCDAATGSERWRKNLKTDFGGKKGDGWGYSESVLIDGPNLICTPGGEQATMVALDKRNGNLVWKTVRPGDRGAGHASVVISQIGKTKVYVQTTASGALGVRASDGKLLWSYEIDKTTAVIPTPIVRGDLVFFSAGYKRGGALLRQVTDGLGVKVEEVYPLNPALANKHGGIVLVGDYLYGDSDDQGIIFCAELMTGEIKWKARGSGHGSASMAAADGCLYIHFSDGVMSLAKADPNGFVETGSFTVPGSGERPSWAHPVIVDGKLYLREQDHLICYNLRK
ncbi:MAG TPA: PQQ-binding-like beta-propeller repeat protein [Pirellulales bacterium]|nr:PQQ-binding-like beta-propeller repeat protein [Pirellulales bacterium]